MNIGIDIDGVLTDMENYISVFGKKYAKENNIDFDEKMDNNTIYGFFTKKDNEKFWDRYWEDYAENVEVRTSASEVIKKLRNEGNYIIIITARTYDKPIIKSGKKRQKNMEKLIIKWLNKNNIIYDKLIFSNLNKLNNCLDNHIDIMLEDSISNIEILKDHIKILMFNTQYNKFYQDDKIRKVYNWNDIYNAINEL